MMSKDKITMVRAYYAAYVSTSILAGQFGARQKRVTSLTRRPIN